MAPRICIVTGASGYVGEACARRLKSRGFQVREAGRSAPPGSPERFILGELAAPALFDSAAALVHCAYDFKAAAPNEIERINVRGSVDLFAAARAAGVPRLIFISS
ncbi:MAG: NAD(P)-dependent oxidoreductase, partial [Elusimicrobia bacterium]|nr:NAD(P)-dependent oxidoreductase [Elusimicrobiota bacterium]